MGKWNKEIGKEETPFVRTLYDRRKHAQLLVDDGMETKRILVQPAKDSPAKHLTDGTLVPIFDATSDTTGVTPLKPPRKFIPVTPTLSEGSFGRKWKSFSSNGYPNDEDLTIPITTTHSVPGPPEKGDEQSKEEDPPGDSPRLANNTGSPSPGSLSSSSEDSAASTSDAGSSSESGEESSASPDGHCHYESTPVEPFSSSVNDDEVACASGSSSGTSIVSSLKTDESEESDESASELRRYHKSIMTLFNVGDSSGLNVNGMSMNVNSVEDFYSFQDINDPKIPLICGFDAVLKNLKGFAKTPVAIGAELHCHISRIKRGVGNNIYPVYYLYLEEKGNISNRILIMVARKRKRSATSNYLISTDPSKLWRGPSCIGKVRSNLMGTEFTIYDGGNSPKHFNYTSLGIDLFNYRQELGAVIYEPNILGFKGPRRMKILFPSMLSESKRFECRPDVEEETILELSKKRPLAPSLIELRNKFPIWNNETHSFVLNFRGRVTQPSVKNFQIIHEDKPEYTILQFGRIDEDNFTMDFAYPLCPLQAFGIALTSCDTKIACE